MKIFFLAWFFILNLHAQDCADKTAVQSAYEAEFNKLSTSIKLLTGLLEGQPIEGATPLETTKKLLLTPESKVKEEQVKLEKEPFYFIYESCFESQSKEIKTGPLTWGFSVANLKQTSTKLNFD